MEGKKPSTIRSFVKSSAPPAASFDAAELSAAVVDWATRELSIVPCGEFISRPFPSAAQIAATMKSPEIAGFWRHLLRHLREKSFTQNVKKNIKLQEIKKKIQQVESGVSSNNSLPSDYLSSRDLGALEISLSASLNRAEAASSKALMMKAAIKKLENRLETLEICREKLAARVSSQSPASLDRPVLHDFLLQKLQRDEEFQAVQARNAPFKDSRHFSGSSTLSAPVMLKTVDLSPLERWRPQEILPALSKAASEHSQALVALKHKKSLAIQAEARRSRAQVEKNSLKSLSSLLSSARDVQFQQFQKIEEKIASAKILQREIERINKAIPRLAQIGLSGVSVASRIPGLLENEENLKALESSVFPQPTARLSALTEFLHLELESFRLRSQMNLINSLRHRLFQQFPAFHAAESALIAKKRFLQEFYREIRMENRKSIEKLLKQEKTREKDIYAGVALIRVLLEEKLEPRLRELRALTESCGEFHAEWQTLAQFTLTHRLPEKFRPLNSAFELSMHALGPAAHFPAFSPFSPPLLSFYRALQGGDFPSAVYSIENSLFKWLRKLENAEKTKAFEEKRQKILSEARAAVQPGMEKSAQWLALKEFSSWEIPGFPMQEIRLPPAEEQFPAFSEYLKSSVLSSHTLYRQRFSASIFPYFQSIFLHFGQEIHAIEDFLTELSGQKSVYRDFPMSSYLPWLTRHGRSLPAWTLEILKAQRQWREKKQREFREKREE